MSPEVGRLGFRIGCLLVLPSAVLLFFLEPGTAEHSITLVTLVMGVIFLSVVAFAVWRSRR